MKLALSLLLLLCPTSALAEPIERPPNNAGFSISLSELDLKPTPGTRLQPLACRGGACAFDFAVIESCAAQNVCEAYRPFAENGKAVFQIEYRGEVPGIGGGACSDAKARHFTPLLADLELDGKAEACPKG